ncbi:Spo0E family sporulation regulatory protein-aspartic acid phosphatase [Desulfosporosinus metallidurans]|uniref:Uncharacterized protein n=1 Tax=Desulfosporosinus metallidurans TaxID=1888891 RepID=A0A1Q8QPM0_9FIRM|nr:Spo0E family sporulation regulatory protein-aspartic acid phosphatase [Desulfosporosinus metallidurans]OLN29266.1 hypothetical protein DSOL_3603 [Desulfosporosinus metallidurans]
MKLTVLERIEELRLQMQKIASDKDLTDNIAKKRNNDLDLI